MAQLGSLMKPVLIASACAGPLVFGFIGLALTYARLPAPIKLQPEDLFGFGMGLALAIIPGFLVGIVTNVIGTSMMVALGNRFDVARYRLIWAIVGAVIVTAFCVAIDPAWTTPQFAIPFIIASGICAWICRSGKPWEAL